MSRTVVQRYVANDRELDTIMQQLQQHLNNIIEYVLGYWTGIQCRVASWVIRTVTAAIEQGQELTLIQAIQLLELLDWIKGTC